MSPHHPAACPTESLVGDFVASSGALGLSNCQGCTLLSIRGTGFSWLPRMNDALLLNTGGPVEQLGSLYQLVATRSGSVEPVGNSAAQ